MTSRDLLHARDGFRHIEADWRKVGEIRDRHLRCRPNALEDDEALVVSRRLANLVVYPGLREFVGFHVARVEQENRLRVPN